VLDKEEQYSKQYMTKKALQLFPKLNHDSSFLCQDLSQDVEELRWY